MTKNRRACWNCDGSVHIHNTKCPYCGTDLTEEPASAVPPPPYAQPESVKEPVKEPVTEPATEHSQSKASYLPPSTPEPASEPEPVLRQVKPQRSLEPETHLINPEAMVHPVAHDAPKPKPQPNPKRRSSMRAIVLPMLMLLPGAFFFLFSAILILFSSEGVLTLQWNSHYWVLYLGLALPLLYFGCRVMNRSEESVGYEQEAEFQD